MAAKACVYLRHQSLIEMQQSISLVGSCNVMIPAAALSVVHTQDPCSSDMSRRRSRQLCRLSCIRERISACLTCDNFWCSFLCKCPVHATVQVQCDVSGWRDDKYHIRRLQFSDHYCSHTYGYHWQSTPNMCFLQPECPQQVSNLSWIALRLVAQLHVKGTVLRPN